MTNKILMSTFLNYAKRQLEIPCPCTNFKVPEQRKTQTYPKDNCILTIQLCSLDMGCSIAEL